jgi:hypothetical protein
VFTVFQSRFGVRSLPGLPEGNGEARHLLSSNPFPANRLEILKESVRFTLCARLNGRSHDRNACSPLARILPIRR